MDVLELPFNKLIGLKKSDKSGYLLMLNDNEKYQNHLQTVHASAMFALAEATSGKFLLSEFRNVTGIIPVVRGVKVQYKKPASGKIYSQAEFTDIAKNEILNKLANKQRLLITVKVVLIDDFANKVMQSEFEWFIAYQ